jgi:putative alpha-1,2-mannosidase
MCKLACIPEWSEMTNPIKRFPFASPRSILSLPRAKLRNRSAILALALTFGFTCLADARGQSDSVSWVNPYIGTGSGPIGYGGTMPFVTPPFGMTDWTPQTRQNRLSVTSYKYEDSTISGFIGTHQPAIWMGDYGYVTVVPEIDHLKITPEDRKLPFSHRQETVEP